MHNPAKSRFPTLKNQSAQVIPVRSTRKIVNSSLWFHLVRKCNYNMFITISTPKILIILSDRVICTDNLNFNPISRLHNGMENLPGKWCGRTLRNGCGSMVTDVLFRLVYHYISIYREVPPQTSLASREEISQCEDVGVWAVLVEDPLFPGEFGLYSRTSTIHEGPSLMANLIDRTLVNVSSWLACVTPEIDGIYVSCPPHRPLLHAPQVHLCYGCM